MVVLKHAAVIRSFAALKMTLNKKIHVFAGSRWSVLMPMQWY
jgi:hypothetical protein